MVFLLTTNFNFCEIGINLTINVQRNQLFLGETSCDTVVISCVSVIAWKKVYFQLLAYCWFLIQLISIGTASHCGVFAKLGSRIAKLYYNGSIEKQKDHICRREQKGRCKFIVSYTSIHHLKNESTDFLVKQQPNVLQSFQE